MDRPGPIWNMTCIAQRHSDSCRPLFTPGMEHMPVMLLKQGAEDLAGLFVTITRRLACRVSRCITPTVASLGVPGQDGHVKASHAGCRW